MKKTLMIKDWKNKMNLSGIKIVSNYLLRIAEAISNSKIDLKEYEIFYRDYRIILHTLKDQDFCWKNHHTFGC